MPLRLLGGTGNPALLDAIAVNLGIGPEERVLERFPDGELHVVLRRSQTATHVAIVQPTGPPVGIEEIARRCSLARIRSRRVLSDAPLPAPRRRAAETVT